MARYWNLYLDITCIYIVIALFVIHCLKDNSIFLERENLQVLQKYTVEMQVTDIEQLRARRKLYKEDC